MRKTAIAVSLVAGCVALPVLADDFNIPARKPGEWRVEMVSGNPRLPGLTASPPPKNESFELCLDAASDKPMMQFGTAMAGSTCDVSAPTQSGGAYSFDATCTAGRLKTKAHTVVSGDFQSAYTMKITTEILSGPSPMPMRDVLTLNATWVGECKGLVPGEMVMPGGMKTNVLEAMKPAH